MVVSVNDNKPKSEKSEVNTIFSTNKVSPEIMSNEEDNTDVVKSIGHRKSCLYALFGFLFVVLVVCVALLGAGATYYQSCKSDLKQCQECQKEDDGLITDHVSDLGEINADVVFPEMSDDNGLWEQIARRLSHCGQLDANCLKKRFFGSCRREFDQVLNLFSNLRINRPH